MDCIRRAGDKRIGLSEDDRIGVGEGNVGFFVNFFVWEIYFLSYYDVL